MGLSAWEKATAAGAPPPMPNWRLPAPCSWPSLVLLPASSKSLLLSHTNMHAILLQCQAHATAGRRGRKPQPATPHHPA